MAMIPGIIYSVYHTSSSRISLLSQEYVFVDLIKDINLWIVPSVYI